MKRKRASRKVTGTVIQDLPDTILTDILVKLSVKRILLCKCVCKLWCELISRPAFAKIHCEKAEAYPVIRTLNPVGVSRIMYMVEPEHEEDLDLRFCPNCYSGVPPVSSNKHTVKKCSHHTDMKLVTKIKLPLRNFDDRDGTDDVIQHHNVEAKRDSCVKLRPKDHKYSVSNSCNGLLCLSEPKSNKPVAICNPLTGEFINLPEHKLPEYPRCALRHKSFVCGLGFSPVTKQYKVIQIFSCTSWTAVQTVGTGKWKDLDTFPIEHSKLEHTTYLNGAIHWLSSTYLTPDIILVFNIDSEKFRSFQLPMTEEGPLMIVHRGNKVSFSTLGGCLCICDGLVPFDIWIMTDYGIRESWVKLLTISFVLAYPWVHDKIVPLKYMSNGGILLFHPHDSAIMYIDPMRKRLKVFKLHGSKLPLEVFAHTPSFVSLKNCISANDQQVRSTKSRTEQFKLEGEARAFSLVEKKPIVPVRLRNDCGHLPTTP